MFKNISLRGMLAPPLLEAAAAAAAFTPTGPTQELSVGWVPPRGEDNGALIESIGGRHSMLRARVETRGVPTATLKEHVDKLCSKIEEVTGRKPGRRQVKELKEQALQELLPHAFPRRADIPVWFDAVAQRLVIGATGSRADLVATLMVRCFDDVRVDYLTTQRSPVHAMASWLLEGETDSLLTIDRECVLESSDELRSVVRYSRHNLDAEEIRDHVRAGKHPVALALTWNGRVSFVLTDALVLRKVEFLDVVFEGKASAPDADAFDADAAIATGELSSLLDDLITALGGLLVREEDPEQASQDAAAAGARLDNLARKDGATVTLSTSDGTVLAHFGDGPDPLYDQAVAIVVKELRASISLIQRHLRIGYNRAARLLERMESEGLVTPMTAEGNRDVRKAVGA